jgi:hypothetical protein
MIQWRWTLGYLGRWNVASAAGASTAFQAAVAFNADISRWNTASLTNVNGMFSGTTAFAQDVSVWNIARVKDMGAAFGSGFGNACQSCPPSLKRAISDAWGPLIRAQYPAWGQLPCVKADIPPANGSAGACSSTLLFNATCYQLCDGVRAEGPAELY